ncbi:MAG TPA: SDR family NAD(P)-dependent oxidoreductase [Thermoleophilaceae bacterium]|nr:SDR family NAD(P)-dependent oxidoreductase [Thermoleophilaceae bacterium]
MPEGALSGRCIAITGASSGIGEAIARAAAAEGAKVALGARRSDRIDELAGAIGSDGGTAVAIEVDVGDEQQANAFVHRARDRLGGLDGLVNNAGVMLLGRVEDAETEHWRRMIDVNLLGLLYCTHAALPLLREGGGGDIVNVSSVAGRSANAGSAVYNLTKFGVTAFSEALRQEALHSGIRVSCVEPGFVDTELQGHNKDPNVTRAIESMREKTGDVLTAEDIARAVTYVLGQPEHVSVNEVLVRPTGQQR